MPRIRREVTEDTTQHADLVARLADELRQDRAAGQPIIEELSLPKTGLLKVTVIWDRWESVRDEDRVRCIMQAYEQAQGTEAREQIALAVGVTFPEARDYRLVPFRIIPALRRGDTVTPDQCREAMIRVGASVLENPEHPLLMF